MVVKLCKLIISNLINVEISMICSTYICITLWPTCINPVVCILCFDNITSGHATQNTPIGFIYAIFTYLYHKHQLIDICIMYVNMPVPSCLGNAWNYPKNQLGPSKQTGVDLYIAVFFFWISKPPGSEIPWFFRVAHIYIIGDIC